SCTSRLSVRTPPPPACALSLHDALPISPGLGGGRYEHLARGGARLAQRRVRRAHTGAAAGALHAEHRVDVRLVRRRGLDLDRGRSEEHTSELQSPCNLVCRLLLEKKKNH